MSTDAHELNMFKQKLGANVKRLRAEKNLSIDGMAILTSSCHSYIWGVENGTVNPSISKILKIAKALGTDVQTLIS